MNKREWLQKAREFQARQNVRIRYSKQAYEDTAKVIREIEQGLVAMAYTLPQRNDIIELITARFANLYSLDNPRFDGFKFNDAARGRK